MQKLTLYGDNSTLTLFEGDNEESADHPKKILPQIDWESLSQEQLLSWSLVAIESVRQNWSLWEAMLEHNLQDDLGFDDDELMLSKSQLLQIAAWTLNQCKNYKKYTTKSANC